MRQMTLIEILLPLSDAAGRPFPAGELQRVRRELTDQFGGATAFERSPAKGDWREPDGDIAHDDVIVVEVMAAVVDRAWWRNYRQELERRFRQDEIVVRCHVIERL